MLYSFTFFNRKAKAAQRPKQYWRAVKVLTMPPTDLAETKGYFNSWSCRKKCGNSPKRKVDKQQLLRILTEKIKKPKPKLKTTQMKWPPSTGSSPSCIIPLLSSHSSCSDLSPMHYMAEERPGMCYHRPLLSIWLPQMTVDAVRLAMTQDTEMP